MMAPRAERGDALRPARRRADRCGARRALGGEIPRRRDRFARTRRPHPGRPRARPRSCRAGGGASARALSAEEKPRSRRWRGAGSPREPVARILGRKEFWSLPLRVDAATLVPRPETETVVEAALAAIDARGARDAAAAHRRSRHRLAARFCWRCCRELPNAFGVGTDMSVARACGSRATMRARLGLARARLRRLRHGGGVARAVRSHRVQSALYRVRRHRRARARSARFRSASGARRRAGRTRLLSGDCRRGAGAAGARRRPGRGTRRRPGANSSPHCLPRRGLRRRRPVPILTVCRARSLPENGHERGALDPGKKALGMSAGTD